MGKRCRLAAWGATFALFVAACATTDTSSSTRAPTELPSTTPPSTVATSVTFPDSLADASFVQASLPDGPCSAGDTSRAVLFNSASGERTWEFPIPRPGTTSVRSDNVVFISFLWDRDQGPGVGALDLVGQAPLWQRFLHNEPESMKLTDHGLIVATPEDVRSLDPESGEDLWVTNSEFDFTNIVLGDEAAYAIDSVGVHAIDYATGHELWQLPIDRPDAVAVHGNTLAVAADSELVAVDLTKERRLWNSTANRLGAGKIWVTPTSVSYELAPRVAPGGGVASLDRTTGFERWRANGIGEPRWVGTEQLVSSTASGDPKPGQPYALFALDATTGDELWRVPATAQAFESVIGTEAGRVVATDPHPAVAGMQRIRLLDAETGETVWETVSEHRFDGATVDAGSFVTLYGSSNALTEDRGSVAMLLGSTRSWSASFADGIAQAPEVTNHGLFVISGERTPTCVGRAVGSPSTQVLGATESR